MKSIAFQKIKHKLKCLSIHADASNKYVLIYGDHKSATYNIYEFKAQKWNEIGFQLNNQCFNNDNIMKDGTCKYGFGNVLSMITDLFAKNKIYIIGGESSYQKYGYFEC